MDYKIEYLHENNQSHFIELVSKILSKDVSFYFNAENFKYYKNILDIKNNVSFLVVSENQPSGFCIGSLRHKRAYIAGIAVKKEFQKRGIGKFILEEVFKLFLKHECESLSLDVDCENINAVKLYEKQGFIISEILNNFRNEKNSFFTNEESNLTIKKDSGTAFQALYRSLGKHKKPWIRELRSIIGMIEFSENELYYFYKNNFVFGYCVLSRKNNMLKIFDIYLKELDKIILAEILSKLLIDEKIVEAVNIYESDILGNLLLELGFFVKNKQFQMEKKIL